ncbi:MAG: VOC family protein [Acidimicrobiales bacterium]|jgi:hypothetical protein|nr:VOC family protein [Acidimicrobiales bacterium]
MSDDGPLPAIIELTVGDDPAAWRAAGFTVDDDGACRVSTVRIHLVGEEGGRRIRSWTLRRSTLPETATDLDGLPTARSDEPVCTGATHPNGVEAIDHVVVVTPDVARTVAALRAAGLEPRRTRSAGTVGAPLVQTFFRAGEVIVELVGPEEPSGDGPAGFFGLAYTVADLDRSARRLGDGLGPAKDAVQPGRRIATLRHKAFGMSVATAFLSPG